MTEVRKKMDCKRRTVNLWNSHGEESKMLHWVAAPEQTCGVGNGCHLSKAKEAVELFKTSHSFLSTNEPLLWLVFHISGPWKVSCWRTFTALELVLAGVLPWGNGTGTKVLAGDNISESSFSWSTVSSLIFPESLSHKKLFGLLTHVVCGISANTCVSSGRLPAGLCCFPCPWSWWNHSPDCLEQIHSWQNPA